MSPLRGAARTCLALHVKMGEYKESVFKAMMWSQGVESLVRDCIFKYIAKGKLSPNDDEIKKIKNKYGLGGLIYAIKPCIDQDLFDRLLSFSKDRNDVAHLAGDRFMKHVLNGAPESDAENEVWKLNEIVKVAGDLYGELLGIHETLCK
jgi:hypothetical protein